MAYGRCLRRDAGINALPQAADASSVPRVAPGRGGQEGQERVGRWLQGGATDPGAARQDQEGAGEGGRGALLEHDPGSASCCVCDGCLLASCGVQEAQREELEARAIEEELLARRRMEAVSAVIDRRSLRT